MGVGIHIKTNIGRGGFIKNITVTDVYMENVRKGIKIAGDVGDHPDESFNPNALPVVYGITLKSIWGEKVQQPGSIQGLKNSPFTGICLSNINLHVVPGPRSSPWKCSDVSGSALLVSPWPCSELTSPHQTGSCSDHFWDPRVFLSFFLMWCNKTHKVVFKMPLFLVWYCLQGISKTPLSLYLNGSWGFIYG